MDYIGATPQANPLLGLLAERLKQAQEFAAKPFGYSNPPAEMIMNLLGVPAVQQTAERLAYGEPLTTGRGMTTQIRPEAVEAALTVAPVAGLLGKGAETAAMAAGRAGERYAEKVVPQIMERGGLPAQLLGDLSQGSIRPMDVWHGSPHGPFTKFDPTKIGSGEGAQAFSYGHYLGEARGTGEEYRQALSKDKFLTSQGLFDPSTLEHLNVKATLRKGDLDKAIELAKKYSEPDDDYPEAAAKAARDLQKLEAIKKIGGISENQGYLYKVDLPDEAIANMLDWDKPLSQQHPDVKKALMEHPDVLDFIKNAESQRNRLNEISPMRLQKIPSASIPYDENKMMGKDVLTAIYQRSSLGKTGEAEEQLRQLGIPGVKYLDEGSRAAGKGTQNFVVFPGGEDLLTIKEINDKPVGGLLGQSKAAEATDLLSYRGSHTAPGPDFGAPLHDLTGGGQMYPADVYSPKAAQYYGTGYPKADKEAFALANKVRGNPDAEVTMYRAVPKNESIKDINVGDWVTLSKEYAKNHGESVLDNDYKILSKKVKAKDLWTNADSIHEFGYWPELKQSKAASVAPINSAESNARKAIENLMNQARYFGVDSPIDYANMPVGAVMQDLDSYLGMSKQVADLPDAAKTSLRNLWYKAEDAANAYKRVYGENKLMGKPEEAANDARKNPMLWDEKKLKKLLKDGTFTQDEYENALAWNRKHQGLLD